MKSAHRKTCANLPPSELDLMLACTHTKRCLIKAGVTTLAQLSGLTRDDLLRIRGIGPVIADSILSALGNDAPQSKDGES